LQYKVTNGEYSTSCNIKKDAYKVATIREINIHSRAYFIFLTALHRLGTDSKSKQAQPESCNLEVLIFTEGGKPENRGKGENQQTTQLT
jgi:hypothetical protein